MTGKYLPRSKIFPEEYYLVSVCRYCVHMLATRHRDMEASIESNGSGAGLDLATPVLERSAWQAASHLLPVSVAWLLAGTAPPLYSRPVQPPPQPHGNYLTVLM